MSGQAVKPLTEEDLIEIARTHRGNEPIATVLDALEEIAGSGFEDEQGGNVEAPTGHFYRFERWIVTTDSQGFRGVVEHLNEADAKREFEAMENAYSEWDDDE